ncbi:MAG TPA: DUF4143 domain-containing protein, partial [Candidatus Micrarchaeota archaeon]|nr:DUF4143 domain-containing protein [Candidatus Micrarchaeota archaeon]
KKLKKMYPSIVCLALLDDKSETMVGKLVENVCAVNSGSKFFWRDAFKDEVDLVLEKDKVLMPIEVKYQNSPSVSKGIEKFSKKYGCKSAIVVTKNLKKTVQNGQLTIHYMPAFEFLLKYSV